MLKHFLSYFIGAAILVQAHISADIIETNEISIVQNYVTDDSLVLFNITGTLYAPVNTLADNQWRTYFAERVRALVSDQAIAENFINKVKNDIVSKIPKKTVEECTPQLIADLQKQQIPVFGITQKQLSTAYADNFGLITSHHLKSIGINLESSLSYLHVNRGESELPYNFDFGLIFTNKMPVGLAISSFLNRLEKKPTKIIMVDNSRDNLENAEETLFSTDIEFEGFRYGRADALKTNFDLILGNIQFFSFIKNGQIISDEEATKIKQANPEENYSLLLDRLILELLNLN